MKKEITFLVNEAEEGGYYAEAVGYGILAEGDTIEELKNNIKSGIDCYFDNSPETPLFAHLHFVRDEIITYENSPRFIRSGYRKSSNILWL